MRNERAANYVTHRSCMVDTRDHEDHTFSGIMFNIFIKETKPIDFISITALWVRGALGELTVWTTLGDFRGKHAQDECQGV